MYENVEIKRNSRELRTYVEVQGIARNYDSLEVRCTKRMNLWVDTRVQSTTNGMRITPAGIAVISTEL